MGDFYEKISVSQSNFSGKGAVSALSSDKIIHILNVYPEISTDWLLLGKGEMLRKNSAKYMAPTAVGSQRNMKSESSDALLDILSSQQKIIEQLSGVVDRLTTK